MDVSLWILLCRLLTEKSDSLVSEVDDCLETLGPLEDNAAFNFVNALEDLLWAFELRATASWVFQLAVKRSIYRHDVFRYLVSSFLGCLHICWFFWIENYTTFIKRYIATVIIPTKCESSHYPSIKAY